MRFAVLLLLVCTAARAAAVVTDGETYQQTLLCTVGLIS